MECLSPNSKYWSRGPLLDLFVSYEARSRELTRVHNLSILVYLTYGDWAAVTLKEIFVKEAVGPFFGKKTPKEI